MDAPKKIPDEVRQAIGKLLDRRKEHGNVSTGRVIRELRGQFGNLPYSERDLENAIARAAIINGLQVSLEAEPRN